MKNRISATLLLVLLNLVVDQSVAEPDFLQTPGGVQFRDLKTGSGKPAETGDVATIHFVGWIEQSGGKEKEFYNTRKAREPVSFVIGTDRVMRAWNEGVTGMMPGGKRLLKVPPSLGYGAKAVEDIVPSNSRLKFIIELINLEYE